MRILIPLMALFFMGCVFYGISAGVQAITRKAAKLFGSPELSNPEARPDAAPLPGYLDELQKLHELHQCGALSQEEFRQFKQHLLPAAGTSAT